MHAPARSSTGFTPVDTAMLVALGGMWGLSFLFIELALRGLGPIWIVAGRTLVGALLLLITLAVRRRSLPRSLRMWARLGVLGVVANAAPWILISMAQQEIPSGLAALLMALVPSSTFVVAAALRMERVTARRVAGLVLALLGVAVIVGPDFSDRGRVLGIAAVVLATLLNALGAVYASRYVSGVVGPLVAASGQVSVAFVVAVVAALLFDARPGTAALRFEVLGPVLALGVLGTGLAFLVFYTLIARVGPTSSTLVTYLIPLVAVAAGVWVLNERFGIPEIVGAAAIAVGIWLAQRRPTDAMEQLEELAT